MYGSKKVISENVFVTEYTKIFICYVFAEPFVCNYNIGKYIVFNDTLSSLYFVEDALKSKPTERSMRWIRKNMPHYTFVTYINDVIITQINLNS